MFVGVGVFVGHGRVGRIGRDRADLEKRLGLAGHWLAGAGGGESRAHRDFRLAETHVAADHPIHRLAGLQVAQHRFDGRALVGRLLEWEAGGETGGKEVRIAAHTIVPRAIGGRGVAAALVERLVEDAQRQGFLIRPDCSYVAKKFSENSEWGSLKA